ncbi:hypothetical protein chiPu_0028858 [Chiloscyllium punctatum]|uniref:Uncharacterized protein n=1 Tax=Chiloscyllium punctatum TaxID=137246 RepID=A0A401TQW6_CHIPU|nr:hypothetical protein [Chiloscyllium punctatum]
MGAGGDGSAHAHQPSPLLRTTHHPTDRQTEPVRGGRVRGNHPAPTTPPGGREEFKNKIKRPRGIRGEWKPYPEQRRSPTIDGRGGGAGRSAGGRSAPANGVTEELGGPTWSSNQSGQTSAGWGGGARPAAMDGGCGQ